VDEELAEVDALLGEEESDATACLMSLSEE
jgi:hypothetical protein